MNMEDLLGVGQPRFPINDLHGLWDPEGKKWNMNLFLFTGYYETTSPNVTPLSRGLDL